MAQSTPALTALLIASLLPAAASAQGSGSLPTSRIFEALAISRGATVCEMGAGDGELSIAAADQVGARGHVYTSELGDERVTALQAKVSAADRPQIHVMGGDVERTNFPDGACDVLFMRNVYHHVETPAVMNVSIAAALRPGGRLVIIDFTPAREAARPADRDNDNTHGVTPATVRRELTAAGFEVSASKDGDSGKDRPFVVVALKPGS